MRDAKPGSVLEMRLLRDKKEMTVKVMVPELLTEPRSVLPVYGGSDSGGTCHWWSDDTPRH